MVSATPQTAYEPLASSFPNSFVTTPVARDVIEQTVAAVFAVPIGDLRAPTRRKARTALARQVAMYLAHVMCGLSLTQVGMLFKRDRTTVSYACATIEDRRDDVRFDRTMDNLERAIGRLLLALHSLEAGA